MSDPLERQALAELCDVYERWADILPAGSRLQESCELSADDLDLAGIAWFGDEWRHAFSGLLRGIQVPHAIMANPTWN